MTMLTRMRWTARMVAAALAAAVMAPGAAGAAEDPVVRTVLFYSPSCGHCHLVLNEALPVIFEEHGGAPDLLSDETLEHVAFYLATNGSFEVLIVDVSTEAGADLYYASGDLLGIPDYMLGVPRLVAGTEYYVGSVDIPAVLPGIIGEGLAGPGLDWPPLPGIEDALAAVPGVPTTTTDPPQPTTTTAPETPGTTTVPPTTSPDSPATTVPPGVDPADSTPGNPSNPFDDLKPVSPGSDVIGPPATTIGEKFRADLAGNVLAVIVLAAMLASLAAVVLLVRRGRLGAPPDWLIPVLAAAGVAVAFYLAYVETSGSEAVCGPVGNCNAVQQSKFALLFGVIPVGVVGLAGYAVVVGGWLLGRWAPRPWSDWARLALAGGALSGVAFSIYLTFLEPFVIGATCLWCLSSAVIVTALWWLSAGPGWASLQRLRG